MRVKSGYWMISVSAAAVLMAAPTAAHITIAPLQSMAGATEKYVLRVPTESKVATVAAELEVPEGVMVEAVRPETLQGAD